MAQSNTPPISDGVPPEWEISYGHEGRSKGATMRPVGNMGSGWGGKQAVPFSNPSSADLTPNSLPIYFSYNTNTVGGPKDELIELLASGDCLTYTPPCQHLGHLTEQSCRDRGTAEQRSKG